MKLTKQIGSLQAYLTKKHFLNQEEQIQKAEIPGEGNMNFTLRIISDQRSFIIKQSRSYVEKYPQVTAPADRCQREAEFYQLIASYHSLASRTPRLLFLDKENNVIIMEDLGQGRDFSWIYNGGKELEEADLVNIIQFAATLHASVKSDTAPFLITNRKMRKLNHQHIYVFPFAQENGLDLDQICEGLSEVAEPYKKDTSLKSIVSRLGEEYLKDGDTLLHGDYFPGSWLKAPGGIKIIDPEFCFFGHPEFEVGVAIAHMMMGLQSEKIVTLALEIYKDLAPLNETKVRQAAGVEIMRRVVGLAQLPINLELNDRSVLLNKAYDLITLK